MAQEFTIKSQDIEDKINQLLPSQGGFQPGVDFSASTMVIPIVDLTETAEGSSLRQDLQTSFSLTSLTFNRVTNTTATLVNTTGYYRVFGIISASSATVRISITDGITSKNVLQKDGTTASNNEFDFVVKLEAGDSLTAFSGGTAGIIQVATRQIADLQGNLINP